MLRGLSQFTQLLGVRCYRAEDLGLGLVVDFQRLLRSSRGGRCPGCWSGRSNLCTSGVEMLTARWITSSAVPTGIIVFHASVDILRLLASGVHDGQFEYTVPLLQIWKQARLIVSGISVFLHFRAPSVYFVYLDSNEAEPNVKLSRLTFEKGHFFFQTCVSFHKPYPCSTIPAYF